MDVSLSGRRVLFSLLVFLAFSLISCGNRYDLSTERGRRARIDDANFFLSQGHCGAANEAIDPLYTSIYVTDEIRIIKSSTYACEAQFNLLTFISNLSSEPNNFKALSKSLSSVPADGARDNMFAATDIITQNGARLSATSRTARENTFMVFLQFGVISSILRNYGSVATDGSQGTDLVYEDAGLNPAGEMSNQDACALAAAFSFVSDSYTYSDLNDSSSQNAVSDMESICTGAGLTSCSQINKARSACDGTNGSSTAAALIVGGVNSDW